MKKKWIIGILTTIACTACFVGCGKFFGGLNSSNASSESSSNEPSSNGYSSSIAQEDEKSFALADSAVALDCFENYVLDTEIKGIDGKISWSSSNPDIVAVDENGCLQTNIKTGTSKITASVGGYSDECEVTVLARSGLPNVSCKNEVIVAIGDSYDVSVNAYYNGIDISEYLTFSVNEAQDGAASVAEARLQNNSLTMTGKSLGQTAYTVSTTIFGQLYAENVMVEVRDTAIVYIVEGGENNRLQLTKNAELFTSNVAVYDNNVRVDNELLEWSIDRENVATIGENGKLLMGDEGVATLSTTYKGKDVAVEVCTVKEHVLSTVKAEEPVFMDLAMNIAVDTTSKSRTYTPNETQFCSFLLSESQEPGKIVNLSVDGKTLPVDTSTYAGGTARLAAEAFGTEIYGEKTLSVNVETQYVVYEYTVEALIVTKNISTLTDFQTAISVQWKGDRIVGYFTLASDMDFNWYEISIYATDWNWDNGFRGTLDGRGYAIRNFESVMYGITSQIGEGAVMKNLKFANVRYNGGETTILGRGAAGATFENIEITLTEDSSCSFSNIQNSCGVLISHDMRRCTYKNITIHAEGKSLQRIFGGTGQERNTCVYENITIYAKEISMYEHDVTDAPNGVTLIVG